MNVRGVRVDFGPAKTGQPAKHWSYGDISKAIALVVVLSLVASVVAALIAQALVEPGQDYEDNAAAFSVILAASFIAQEVFLLGAALWFGLRKYQLRSEALGIRKAAGTSWWFSWALGTAALLIANGYVAILSLAGIDAGGSTPDQVFDNVGPLIVVIVGAVLMAPIVEEIFFRGFVFGGLWQRNRWVQAGILSSLLFGLAHLSLYLVPPFAAIGFLFAWSYRRTGSLIPGILAHGITNAVSVGIGVATSGVILGVA